MFTREDLDKLLSDARQICRDSSVPISESICPKVYLIDSHRTLGECCSKKGRPKSLPKDYDFVIRISSHCLEFKRPRLLNTMLHELLHSCPDCLNHGPKWREYAAILKARYGVNITRLAHLNEDERKILHKGYIRKRITSYRFTLTCPGCGHEWHYKKASRAVKLHDKCECPICKTEGLQLSTYANPTK